MNAQGTRCAAPLAHQAFAIRADRARAHLLWFRDLFPRRLSDPAMANADDAPSTAGGPRRDAELARLLACSAAGDVQAFERYYDGCVVYARALARRFVRDAEIADVLAESFFQAWREAPRFDVSRGAARSWLLTIVRSRALDLLRQRRGAAATGAVAAPDTPSDEPGPGDLLAQAQAGTRLHQALLELSSQERWVLGLAYYREMAHAEIAAATRLPLGTVKSLIHRAQRKLRARLEPATQDQGARAS
jgi:RNA polymerase sigma-70 factor (ECF subfamily)